MSTSTDNSEMDGEDVFLAFVPSTGIGLMASAFGWYVGVGAFLVAFSVILVALAVMYVSRERKTGTPSLKDKPLPDGVFSIDSASSYHYMSPTGGTVVYIKKGSDPDLIAACAYHAARQDFLARRDRRIDDFKKTRIPLDTDL